MLLGRPRHAMQCSAAIYRAPVRSAPRCFQEGSGSSVRGPPTAQRVKVRFSVPKQTRFGERIGLVSSATGWDPKRPVKLRWSEGGLWHGEAELPAGQKVEYKYLLVSERDGSVTWQPGRNLELLLDSPQAVLVLDDWLGSTQEVKPAAPASDAPVTAPAAAAEQAAAAAMVEKKGEVGGRSESSDSQAEAAAPAPAAADLELLTAEAEAVPVPQAELAGAELAGAELAPTPGAAAAAAGAPECNGNGAAGPPRAMPTAEESWKQLLAAANEPAAVGLELQAGLSEAAAAAEPAKLEPVAEPEAQPAKAEQAAEAAVEPAKAEQVAEAAVEPATPEPSPKMAAAAAAAAADGSADAVPAVEQPQQNQQLQHETSEQHILEVPNQPVVVPAEAADEPSEPVALSAAAGKPSAAAVAEEAEEAVKPCKSVATAAAAAKPAQELKQAAKTGGSSKAVVAAAGIVPAAAPAESGALRTLARFARLVLAAAFVVAVVLAFLRSPWAAARWAASAC